MPSSVSWTALLPSSSVTSITTISRLKRPSFVARVPADVEGLRADLAHAAEDHVLDLRRIDLGTFDQRLEHARAQVVGMQAREPPLLLAARRPHRPCNERLRHGRLRARVCARTLT